MQMEFYFFEGANKKKDIDNIKKLEMVDYSYKIVFKCD